MTEGIECCTFCMTPINVCYPSKAARRRFLHKLLSKELCFAAVRLFCTNFFDPNLSWLLPYYYIFSAAASRLCCDGVLGKLGWKKGREKSNTWPFFSSKIVWDEGSQTRLKNFAPKLITTVELMETKENLTLLALPSCTLHVLPQTSHYSAVLSKSAL